MRTENQFFACVAGALVILVWGITFVNTRALLGDFSALEILFGRFALAWGALWLVRSREAIRKCHADERLFAAMGFCGVVFYQFLENCAIYYTNASNVAIFMSFGPIVTAVLVRSLIKERGLSVTLLIGSLIAIVGVTLVSLNGVVNLQLCPLGDLMAIGAMVSWGFYSILIDKVNKKGYPPGFVIRKAFGWSLLMMLPFCVWGATDSGYCALDGSFSVTLDWAANVERFSSVLNWVNLGFLGLLASGVCFMAWNFVCKEIGVIRATVGLYFTPVIGVVFAALFLDERLTLMSVCGGILIIGGVILANWRRK